MVIHQTFGNLKWLRKGRKLLAGALAVLSSSPVVARTVTVASCDRETGATVLAISAAEAGDGTKALVAAWSPYDVGNVATNARETAYVGAVAVAETEKTFTIPAAWRGKTGVVRFFLMSGIPPYDERLASLRSVSSGPYIDTGFVPTVNSDIRVTASYPGEMAPFGISGKCHLFNNSSSSEKDNWYCGFMGDSGSGLHTPRSVAVREHWLNATGAYLDGMCLVAFDPTKLTGATSNTLTLFARKNDGSAVAEKQGDCTIYSAQLREGDALVHDYVPCRKNGVATMYDRATRTFCTVSGNGAFTAGEALGPAPEDCGAVESVSTAIAFAPAIEISSLDSSTGEITVSLTGTHDAGVLYAVGGASDAGPTLAGWSEVCFLGKVAAEDDALTASLPVAWLNNQYNVRVLWRSSADFPYDREVEWLYSSGSAYALPGTIPNRGTEISVQGRSNNDVCLFGLTTYFYCFSTGGGTCYYGFFGQSGSFNGYNPYLGFQTLTLGPSGVFLDGVQKVSFTPGSTTFTQMSKSVPICFRRNYQDGSFSKNGECWIKRAQIRECGRQVFDLVPCVTNSVACFYDRVSKQFFVSRAAQAFVPGDTVANVTDAEAVAWSGVAGFALNEATWDGGGSDNSFATAANWEGDFLPDLVNGSATLTFATGGSEARVATANTSVFGVRFDTADDFALTAAPGASLLMGGGGITLADRTTSGSWRRHDLNLPVTLAADQTWNLSSESYQRIRVYGNIGGEAARTLTVTGNGCLSIYSTNDFAGTVELAGGVTKVFSKQHPFGSAASGGRVIIDQSKNAILELWGATVDKPIQIASTDASDTCFASCTGYGENVFAAPIYQTGLALNWQLREGSTTRLCGGGSFEGPVVCQPANSTPRTMVIEGERIVFLNPGNENKTFKFHGKTELHLKNQNNTMPVELGASSSGGGSTLHCWTNDVLNISSDIILAHGSVMDLHGFDQTIGDLKTGSSGHVQSDAPATLFAYFDDNSGTTWGVDSGVENEVSFTKSGPSTLTINGTNTTMGTLAARNGPLVIGATGVWYGTNVVIGVETSNRHPSLRLTHNACFADPKHTVLSMTTSTGAMQSDLPNPEPELVLDEGVCHVFAEVWINGRRLASGTWGGSESSAQHKDSVHFSGRGVIHVRGGGFVISIN